MIKTLVDEVRYSYVVLRVSRPLYWVHITWCTGTSELESNHAGYKEYIRISYGIIIYDDKATLNHGVGFHLFPFYEYP